MASIERVRKDIRKVTRNLYRNDLRLTGKQTLKRLHQLEHLLSDVVFLAAGVANEIGISAENISERYEVSKAVGDAAWKLARTGFDRETALTEMFDSDEIFMAMSDLRIAASKTPMRKKKSKK